jgi:hypothetical protein
MGEYLHLLEVRAKIEDIDLEDAIQYFSDKKRDREIKVIDKTATVENADTVSFGEKEKEAFEQVLEERREEIKFELSVCANCVHYPICRYLVGHFEKFKLPRGEQSCDLFMSTDGCDEPSKKGKVCDKENVNSTEVLPEGVMSVQEVIETIMNCGSHGACDSCPHRGSNCGEKLRESTIYHLINYADAKRA